MASNGTNGVNTSNYIRWNAEGIERIPPTKKEDIQAVADMINMTSETGVTSYSIPKARTPVRKDWSRGSLSLAICLLTSPRELFSKSGEFPIAIRYSTEIADLSIGFNGLPALDLADAKTAARDEIWNTHLESIRQYFQTAYRFGDYIAKYSLVPSPDNQKDLHEETAKPDSHPNHIFRDWVKFCAKNDAEYLFQVQFCENLEDRLIEYAGKEWNSEKYPSQTVANVCFPKQVSMIPARKPFWEDHSKLDSWHGLKSFQPLESPKRPRGAVYPASAAPRHKMNGRTEISETSIDQFPVDMWRLDRLWDVRLGLQT